MNLAEVQAELINRGVRSIGFHWDRDQINADVAAGKLTFEELKQDVADILTEYLNGNIRDMEPINDRHLAQLKEG